MNSLNDSSPRNMELAQALDTLIDSVQSYCRDNIKNPKDATRFTALVLTDGLNEELNKKGRRRSSTNKQSPDMNAARALSEGSKLSRTPLYGDGYRDSVRKIRQMELPIETVRLELASSIAKNNNPLLCKYTSKLWAPLLNQLNLTVSCKFIAQTLLKDTKAALIHLQNITKHPYFPGASGSLLLATIKEHLDSLGSGYEEERILFEDIMDTALNVGLDIPVYFEKILKSNYPSGALLDHFEDILSSMTWNLDPDRTIVFFRKFFQLALHRMEDNSSNLVKLIRFRRFVQNKCQISLENLWDNKDSILFLNMCSQYHLGYGELTNERAKCFLNMLQKAEQLSPRYELVNRTMQIRSRGLSERAIDHHQFSKLLESLLKHPNFSYFTNTNEVFKNDIGLIADELVRCKPLFLNYRTCAYYLAPLFPDKAFSLLKIGLEAPLSKNIDVAHSIGIIRRLVPFPNEKIRKEIHALLKRDDIKEMFQSHPAWQEL